MARSTLSKLLSPFRRSRAGLGLACLLGLVNTACGIEFDPASEVTTLRVISVQKDKPYARSGDTVQLSLWYADASEKAPRNVEVLWLGGCENPPGDLYAGCFEQFDPNNVVPGAGDQFNLQLSSDIISSHGPPADPSASPYGIAYVFFAVCAGTLGVDTNGDFPITCRDASGNALGADDFVAGYSGIYVYDDPNVSNTNPNIGGFSVNGVTTADDTACVGTDCFTNPNVDMPDCSQPDVPCIEACEADGSKDDCPEYPILPLLDSSIVELDTATEEARAQGLTEQMWIKYFSEKGSVDNETRLLNDAAKGFNADYGTKFRAPKEKGPMRLWAVVYDNRGGQNWVEQRIVIR